MRYIYVDEAGVSQNEPVRVVAGVVVHPDFQWRAVENRLAEIFDAHVPPQLRPGFVFHAKHVFGMGKEERALWEPQSRWNLLNDVLGMPMDMHLPVVVGMVRKDSSRACPPDMHKHDFEHAMAFYYCAAAADEYLRKSTPENEVATLVSEDFPRSKRAVNAAVRLLREHSRRAPISRMLKTHFERKTGVRHQSGEFLIQRIVGNPHFEGKAGVPLLQIADACAFAFRRYFAHERHGEELLLMLLRAPLVRDDWRGPGSNAYFIRPPVDGR